MKPLYHISSVFKNFYYPFTIPPNHGKMRIVKKLSGDNS